MRRRTRNQKHERFDGYGTRSVATTLWLRHTECAYYLGDTKPCEHVPPSGASLHIIYYPRTYAPGNLYIALRAIKMCNSKNHASGLDLYKLEAAEKRDYERA